MTQPDSLFLSKCRFKSSKNSFHCDLFSVYDAVPCTHVDPLNKRGCLNTGHVKKLVAIPKITVCFLTCNIQFATRNFDNSRNQSF